ncbi:MAG: MMPL family transporter [Caulobacteraceae bacterium]|nr:MMPL family transporter [Caulobacter sp.]
MLSDLITRLVALSCRRPWAVTLVAFAAVAGALAFAATHFRMDTDTAKLIAPSVHWRQDEIAVSKAFPQNDDLIVAVVDAATPELAELGATRLAARLSQETKAFELVRRPDGGPFFAKEGLLFQSLPQVRATTAQLIQAQPFLGPLAADPSLRGVAQTLTTLAQGVSSGNARLADVDAPMKGLADAFDGVLAGRPTFFCWQALVAGGGKGGLSAPTRRFVLVKPRLDYAALQPGAEATGLIRSAARDLRLDAAHGITVRLTGSVPLSDEEFASLSDHVWVVTGVMLTLVLLMLWLAVRSAKLVAAILVTTLAGLAIATAMGTLLVGAFNLISVAFIPLFVGLGVDFGIQLSVRFRAERLEHPAIDAALERAGGSLGTSLLLAATAVTLGFLAFLPTNYVGVSELGVIAGVGMVFALLLALTLLPALLVLLKPRDQGLEVGWRQLKPVDDYLVTRRKTVLWAFVGAMVLSIALLPLVRFDFNPFHLRNPHGEAMRTLNDLFKDPQENPNTIDVLAPSQAAADALAARIDALPQVAQTITLTSFVPSDQPAKLAAISDADSLLDFTLNPLSTAPPPSDGEVVQALRTAATALDAAAAASKGLGVDDARRLSHDLSQLAAASPQVRARAADVVVTPLNVLLDQVRALLTAAPVTVASLPADIRADWLSPVTGQARIQVSPKGDANSNAVLVRFSRAVLKVAPDASGAPISIQGAGDTIAHAFVKAGILSLIAITLLLFVALRSVKEVAFTLAPIVLSVFLTLGTCVVIGQPINFANIIAFPLLVGVGVAFHIYFVMAWRGGQGELLQSSLARGVLFSALTTGAAFGSLMLSSHPGTASMGKLLMISLFWTLVCALIFEPALLGPPTHRPEEEAGDSEAVAAG